MPRTPGDHVRQFRAKQEIHSGRDRLLNQGNRRIDLRKLIPGDPKDGTRLMLWTLFLSVASIGPFALMILVWFLFFRSSLPATIALYLVLLGFSGFLAMASTRRALGVDRPWLRWIGYLCAQSATLGLIVGFFVYFRFLVFFLTYEEMRTYTNVAGVQSSSEFDDASAFLFSEDTRVDPMRAVGFKSRWTGDVYCVAPVVDSTMTAVNSINFWVAGVNCCPPRASFHCDDADDFQAKGALVWLDPAELVSPYMKWAVQGSDFSHFQEAISVQQATYYTQSSPVTKFLRWSKDPMKLKNTYYETAKKYCLYIGLGYFASLLVATSFIAMRFLPRKPHGAKVPLEAEQQQ